MSVFQTAVLTSVALAILLIGSFGLIETQSWFKSRMWFPPMAQAVLTLAMLLVSMSFIAYLFYLGTKGLGLPPEEVRTMSLPEAEETRKWLQRCLLCMFPPVSILSGRLLLTGHAATLNVASAQRQSRLASQLMKRAAGLTAAQLTALTAVIVAIIGAIATIIAALISNS